MYGPSLRRVGQGILELVNRNVFGTFDLGDLDPSINRVSRIPKMDVWTRLEEGRSKRSRVIYQKRFWYMWPWPSDSKI